MTDSQKKLIEERKRIYKVARNLGAVFERAADLLVELNDKLHSEVQNHKNW